MTYNYKGDEYMAVYVHEMLDYLDVHPVRNYQGTADMLLKMLCRLYAEYNTQPPVDDCRLSGEELAFAQGILVGMHLMSELRTVP